MAPAVATEHAVFDDPEEASEDLYKVLGLENKLHVYESIQKSIHQRVDQLLNLCVPAEGQTENVNIFLKQVVNDFPGYFRNKPDSKKRKTLLREYARRYLEVKRLELNLNHPAQANIIRAERPPLKLRIPAKENPDPTDADPDVEMSSALPIDTDTPMHDDDITHGEEELQVDPPVSKRRVSFAIHESLESSPQPANELTPSSVPEMSAALMPEDSSSDFLSAAFLSPEPSSAPVPSRLPSPAPDFSVASPAPESFSAPDISFSSQPSPSHVPEPEPEPEVEEPRQSTPDMRQGPIEAFLFECYPPMPHCARPLHLAGVVEAAHLLGMAHWPERRLRKFLREQDITRTSLENEVLMIRFEKLAEDYFG